MDSITLHRELTKRGINLTGADSLEEKQLTFERALQIVIPPRDQSDRTSFRKISNWLVGRCLSNKFNEHIVFRRVLDFALEASGPRSRNPAAVFTSILKKELGYLK